MSNPEAIALLANSDGALAFDEPWQAQLLGLAYALSQAGVFTPAAWSDTLGAELRAAAIRGAPDTQTTYYEAALAALERLTAGGVSNAELAARITAWRRAYETTPHGQPVTLGSDDDPEHQSSP